MDAHTRAARDKADDVVARNRGAAAGKLDQAVIKPLDQHAVHRVALALVAALRLLGDLIKRGLLVAGLVALQLILDAVYGTRRGNAAVPDSSIEIIDVLKGKAL